MTDINYDALDPGICRVVRWLRGLGYDTCDSGDGKTKFAKGIVDRPPSQWRRGRGGIAMAMIEVYQADGGQPLTIHVVLPVPQVGGDNWRETYNLAYAVQAKRLVAEMLRSMPGALVVEQGSTPLWLSQLHAPDVEELSKRYDYHLERLYLARAAMAVRHGELVRCAMDAAGVPAYGRPIS